MFPKNIMKIGWGVLGVTCHLMVLEPSRYLINIDFSMLGSWSFQQSFGWAFFPMKKIKRRLGLGYHLARNYGTTTTLQPTFTV